MSTKARPWLTGLIGAAAMVTAQAGTVEVSYDPSAAWSDVGETPHDREANLAALAATLRALGPELPGADALLQVRLTDVDLAGTVLPARRGGQPIRVVRGSADWPRIHLQYTLLQGGQTVRSGDEALADLNYTGHDGSRTSDPLVHEKRLLTDWFRNRFAGATVAPQ